MSEYFVCVIKWNILSGFVIKWNLFVYLSCNYE